MPSVRRWSTLLLLAGFLSLLPLSAQGQEPQPAPEGPRAVPSVEIPVRLDDVAGLIRRVEAALPVATAIATIDEAVPAKLAELETESRGLQERLGPVPTTRAVEDADADWLRHRRELVRWQAEIDDRWRSLQSYQGELVDERDVWRVTLESVREQDPSSGLLARIRPAIAALETTLGQLDSRLTSLLDIQVRIGAGQDLVSSARQTIAELASDARGRLLERSTEPLWVTLADSEQESFGTTLRDLYTDSWTTLADFATSNWPTLLWHVVLVAVLAGLLHGARIVRDRDGMSPWQGGLAALDLPLSSAFLLSLLFVPAVYTSSPTVVVEGLMLLATVPLLRVGSRVLPATIHGTLRWLCVLLAIYLIVTPVNDQAPFTRLVLVVVGLLGAISFTALARGLRDPDAGPWRRTAGAGLRAGSVLLGIAVVASVLGWSALAWTLTDGTVASAYTAMLLACVARVLFGLVDLLPQSGLQKYVRHLETRRVEVRQWLRVATRAVVWALWIYVALSAFALWRPVLAWFQAALAHRLGLGALSFSLGEFLTVLAILAGTVVLSRYVRFLLQEEVFARLEISVGESSAISTVVHYGIVFAGILAAASAAGLTGTQLTVVAGSLGLGIGFGLQAIVNNFVSGLILVFERPISVDDAVQVGTHSGVVSRIGIRASVVRTYSGAEIVIPNGDFITKEVVNWTLSDRRRRIELPVGVAYGSDTAAVLEVLNRVPGMDPRVIEEPPPTVVFTGFGASSLDFEMRCWVSLSDFLTARSEMALAINQQLADAGITIPFPQRDLHLASIAPELRVSGSVTSAADAESTASDDAASTGLDAPPDDDEPAI